VNAERIERVFHTIESEKRKARVHCSSFISIEKRLGLGDMEHVGSPYLKNVPATIMPYIQGVIHGCFEPGPIPKPKGSSISNNGALVDKKDILHPEENRITH
jgi:hypothetical protein